MPTINGNSRRNRMRREFFSLSPYARGGAKGGCYRRKDGDGEVQDFLPNVFAHFDFLYFSSADFADNADFFIVFFFLW